MSLITKTQREYVFVSCKDLGDYVDEYYKDYYYIYRKDADKLIKLKCRFCSDETHILNKCINIKELYLESCRIDIPCNLVNLVELTLFDTEYLKEIPDTLLNLKKLSLDRCYNLKCIPNTLINLETLILNAKSDYEIPNNLKIKTLELNNIYQTEFINCNVEELKTLKIKSCNFDTIPSNLLNLEILNISHCNNIRNIPKTLINLQSLIIYSCSHIQTIPETLINLREIDMKIDIFFNVVFKLYYDKEEIKILSDVFYLPLTRLKKLELIKIINYYNIEYTIYKNDIKKIKKISKHYGNKYYILDMDNKFKIPKGFPNNI